MLKPSVFHIFHLWKAFREYHFVLRGPIQNEESCISCRRNDHLFTTPGKKVWKCLLIQKIPCPNGLEASFLNSATSIWEFLNGTPLEASRPLPTIFFGSSMGFVFLGKRDWLPFVQVFFFVGYVQA
jgi:hypothetical protein